MNETTTAVRIATRASALALWQARAVAESLARHGARTRLIEVSTKGDEDQRPFASMPGSGFFTKAVQDAVLSGAADIAVHSYKDLPSAPTPGLVLAAVPARADARDVLLVLPAAHDPGAEGLPLVPGARVGTSAARRRAQLLALRPDIAPAELRGNVPTRVAKLRDGLYDAIVLAKAGLDRLELDLDGLHAVTLEPEVMMPAPAQGALAIEAREDDQRLLELLGRLDDHGLRRTVTAERELMALFDAGCQLALGAHATRSEDDRWISLSAWYDSRRVLCGHQEPAQAALLAFKALQGTEPASMSRSGESRSRASSSGASSTGNASKDDDGRPTVGIGADW
ncbi:MAG TPA: hydroxymethylbilane synthase [Trueperaceae bacterium]|nr:hydroxymethylbilane synthase [Trueperaceae bacterium]